MSREPTHQRNQVVAETTQEQRRQQIDHHDHAVHRDKLQVGVPGSMNDQRCRENPAAGASSPESTKCYQADKDRGAARTGWQ